MNYVLMVKTSFISTSTKSQSQSSLSNLHRSNKTILLKLQLWTKCAVFLTFRYFQVKWPRINTHFLFLKRIMI